MPEFFAIVGATGTGKSRVALDLAQALAERGTEAEIVNADAMQLYRGMDIGTAKLPKAERRGIPHHLIDVLDPAEEASVAAYQPQARLAVESILARGRHAILVGGSGLYVSAVLFQFSFPGTDPAVRRELEAQLERDGPGLLYQRLIAIDRATAEAIGPHNGRRLVRALEVIELTGNPAAAKLPDHPVPWRPARIVRLDEERAILTTRLDARVALMWRDGLVAEVAGLEATVAKWGATAAKAIGYAQARAYLRGELTKAEAIAQTQALTRTYARRQVNWFTRYRTALELRSPDTDAARYILAAFSGA